MERQQRSKRNKRSLPAVVAGAALCVAACGAQGEQIKLPKQRTAAVQKAFKTGKLGLESYSAVLQSGDPSVNPTENYSTVTRNDNRPGIVSPLHLGKTLIGHRDIGSFALTPDIKDGSSTVAVKYTITAGSKPMVQRATFSNQNAHFFGSDDAASPSEIKRFFKSSDTYANTYHNEQQPFDKPQNTVDITIEGQLFTYSSNGEGRPAIRDDGAGMLAHGIIKAVQ